MGLLGKYTTYVGGVATDAHKLLAQVFSQGPYATLLAAGNEAGAQAAVIAVATSDPGPDPNGGGLQPAHGIQQGDLGMFPNGVDMTFAGSLLAPPNSPPDVSTVKWVNAGDPANPYIPDITSPPDGGTEGSDKNVNPQISIAEIQEFSTTEDAAGQDLRNPVSDGPAVVANNIIGKAQKLGDSGGNV
jgi:hypothetical protein